MRLWPRGTRKRLAKKRMARGSYRKLNLARHLVPGDLITTCVGYNEVISEIEPEWTIDGVIFDFQIWTESGRGCSLRHCCVLPRWTREEVLAHWEQVSRDPYLVAMRDKMESLGYILDGLATGQEVFDEQGCLIRREES